MSAPIFAPWPFYAEDEIAAVAAVLHSGKVNYRTGPEGKLFEAEYAAATGAKHALTVANGTAALELALEALEIGTGDRLSSLPEHSLPPHPLLCAAVQFRSSQTLTCVLKP